MKLDELARNATDSLLAGTTPDTTTGLAHLRRSSRRRSTARVAAAGLAVVTVLGGTLAVTRADDSAPEPAEPVVRNGALLVTTDSRAFRMVDGGGALDLPDDHYAYYDSTFTADGRELVYTSVDGRVVAHDVVTGDARELWDCGRPSPCFWAVSPDAERLAVVVEEGIEVHTVDDGTSTTIRTPETPGAYLDWSPDGRSLLFSGTESIYTIGVDGSDLRSVAATAPLHLDFPRVAWSPDGTTIAFVDSTPLEEPSAPNDVVESQYTLRLVAPNGEDLRTVQDLGVCACLGLVSPDLAWAPDGSGIAFTKVGRIRSHGAHLLDLGTGQLRELSPDANGFLAWEPAVSD